MFLKSLYISGFKSFAYPTKLDFTDDISAIVGPNGSGKSNISDAIRFVLGEQRTRLMRSHSMQDIIFSGTDSENPRGVAQVRLIMAREDQPDLIIERKYYRTGESEYLLNGNKVRLRDIQAEFLDTGLGKNGYSIISQGGVENIVGASPVQLKELVEEAVGIAGYKLQQKETVRRLTTIEDNIERVSDILDEMEKQLKPLKKNADKTRQYLEISNTLRDIDLVSFYDSEVESNKRLKEFNNTLVDVNFSIVDLDKLAEEKDKKFIELQSKGQELQKEISELTNKQDQLKENEHSYLIQTNEAEKDQQTSKIRLENIQERIKELKGLIKRDSSILNDLKKEKQTKEEYFNSLKIDLEKENSHLEELVEQLNKIKTSQSPEYRLKLQNQLNELNMKKARLEAEFNNQQKIKTDYENQIKELKLTQQELLKQEKVGQEEKNKTLKDFNLISSQNNNLLKQQEKLRSKYNNLISEIKTLDNNINFQKQLKNSYSGFNEAVKAVMNFSRQNKNLEVFGTVSDLFTTEEKYQTAIQIALGYSAQNIVVQNSSIAGKLINYLKSTRKGRATFLPLESLKPVNRRDSDKILSFPGVIGFADSLIKTEKKYNLVFNRLLGNTVIVENFKDAQNIRKKFNYFTLVTLSGECFYSSGAIVGGSVSKNSSRVFLPQQELKKLNQNKSQLEEKLQKAKIDLSKSKEELIKVDNKRSEINDSLSSINNSLSVLESRKQYNLKEQNRLNSLLPDFKNLENSIANLDPEIKQISSELENLNSYSKKVNIDSKNLEEKVLSRREKVANLKIDLNSLSNELKFTDQRIEEVNHRIELNKKVLQNQSNELDQYKSNILEQTKKIEELSNSKETINSDLTQIDFDLKEKQKELDDNNAFRISIEDEIKGINKSRITEVEEKSRIEREIDKIEFKQNELQKNIEEKYNQTFESIKPEIDQLRERKKDLNKFEIKDLKDRLKKIGSVNINALDDYLELKHRYIELKENYDDLIESKKDVEETIYHLNKTMSSQFKEKFVVLNDLFNKAFSTLFEGGKARLGYTDEDDILNTGIELFAQPPGKNLKNINLLSGGEKAMTAIALLFAFIQLNPTPFIIIDEIDAALDDSNINRFTKYIEKIREENQFIVITHRKGTIQMCNNIHGISMASDGISRSCSFEMSDYVN